MWVKPRSLWNWFFRFVGTIILIPQCLVTILSLGFYYPNWNMSWLIWGLEIEYRLEHGKEDEKFAP